MAEELEKAGDAVQNGLGKVQTYIDKNPKKVLGIGGGAVALVAILLFVFMYYLPNQNEKAEKAIYMAEFEFAKDSFAVALNGRTTGTPFIGFAKVASDYGMTKTGKLANYYAGICCLNLKKYADAVSYLDKFSTSDPIIGALHLSALGDANSELGKLDDAIKNYEKAASFSENESYTPYFLFKAGLANEKAKKNEEAKKLYEQVKEKYPTSDEGRDIEKYIARVTAQ